MGRRRSILTKKEIELLSKEPHLLLYFLGVCGFGISFVCFNSGILNHWAWFSLIGGIICVIIGIVIHICMYISRKETSQPEIKEAKPVSKPRSLQADLLSSLTTYNLDNYFKKELATRYLERSSSTECMQAGYSYTPQNIRFIEESRVVKVDFRGQKRYRTVVKYVQQNYERHPVYSNWKYTYKTVSKTIRVTNDNLESKNAMASGDSLLFAFLNVIISKALPPDLYPSWLLQLWLTDELNLSKEHKFSASKKASTTFNELRAPILSDISVAKEQKQPLVEEKTRVSAKLDKVIAKKSTECKKAKKIQKKLSSLEDEIKLIDEYIKQYNDKIQEFENQKEEAIKAAEDALSKATTAYNTLKKQVFPLPGISDASSQFISLKDLTAFKYEKLIGCYVIKNKSNGKYYVGQSKDVLRRLKQHFKGTIPQNPIFAEDYYTTDIAERENLFEVSIIPLETKDELDKTERELIEQFGANVTGYNSTRGNT